MAGAAAWAAVVLLIALSALGDASEDARALVTVASILGPASALGAAWLLDKLADRWAGLLLLASAATPTYGAAVLNLAALGIGLALLLAPTVVLPRGHVAAP